MKTSIVGTLVGAGVLAAVPAIAIASNVLVDHGRGPTVVHDTAYADVKTQVHSWAADGGTDVRLMVRGLPADRTFGAHVHTAPCGTTRRRPVGTTSTAPTRRSRWRRARSGWTSRLTTTAMAPGRRTSRGSSRQAPLVRS